MRIRTSLNTIAALLFLPSIVLAEAGWTEHASVAELTPTVHGRFLVKLSVVNNPSGCKEKQTFYRDYNLPGAELMFQTLLEAVSSGKRVRVYVTGICDINNYSEITSVGIVP
jgi:hypothetical protein